MVITVMVITVMVITVMVITVMVITVIIISLQHHPQQPLSLLALSLPASLVMHHLRPRS
jgi:hypothetical protein